MTKIIIGLGNTGGKYQNNRHNVGHLFIDSLNSTDNFKLAKTDGFMNESGVSVKKITKNSGLKNPEELYIVHDDLDIPLGKFKIQLGVGPKVHNGLDSVEEQLGTKDFFRIRIGVDNRDLENRIPGEKYVLEDFTKAEKEILNKVFTEIEKELENRI